MQPELLLKLLLELLPELLPELAAASAGSSLRKAPQGLASCQTRPPTDPGALAQW